MSKYGNSELWGTSTGGSYPRCYETHPPLPIKVGDKTFNVYGGSCSNAMVRDAHIYVALQAGSRMTLPQPWEPGYGKIIQVDYPIYDGAAPSSVESFKKMIDWLCNQLQTGKKIHVGCIGGHGRTGTVLAAMVAQLMPEEKDAIGYVRKHYCEKAVESTEQVNFLAKYYGVEKVKGSKAHYSTKGGYVSSTGSVGYEEWKNKQKDLYYDDLQKNKKGGAPKFKSAGPTAIQQAFAASRLKIDPAPSGRNIFSA